MFSVRLLDIKELCTTEAGPAIGNTKSQALRCMSTASSHQLWFTEDMSCLSHTKTGSSKQSKQETPLRSHLENHMKPWIMKAYFEPFVATYKGTFSLPCSWKGLRNHQTVATHHRRTSEATKDAWMDLDNNSARKWEGNALQVVHDIVVSRLKEVPEKCNLSFCPAWSLGRLLCQSSSPLQSWWLYFIGWDGEIIGALTSILGSCHWGNCDSFV